MQVTTFEGIVKNGQIQLTEDITLPERARVFVVLPHADNVKRIMSPKLVNRSDAKTFDKTIEVDIDDEI